MMRSTDRLAWLTLHALLLEPASRNRYALSPHRRATLLRLHTKVGKG
jgi:hypothetical protein